MAQKLRNPFGVPDVRLPPRHGLDVLGIDDQQLTEPFEQIVDRTPIHASQNVAKKILEWEYGIEIVRTRLLMRTEEQRHASSCDTVSSHQGTCL